MENLYLVLFFLAILCAGMILSCVLIYLFAPHSLKQTILDDWKGDRI